MQTSSWESLYVIFFFIELGLLSILIVLDFYSYKLLSTILLSVFMGLFISSFIIKRKKLKEVKKK